MTRSLATLYVLWLCTVGHVYSTSTQLTNQQAETIISSSIKVWEDPSMPDSARLKAAINVLRLGSEYDHVHTPVFANEMMQGLLEAADTTAYLPGRAYGLQAKATKAMIMQEFDLALRYIRQSLDLFAQLDDTIGMAISESTLGTMSMNAGAYSQAEEHLKRSVELYYSSGMIRASASHRLELTRAIWKQSDSARALRMAAVSMQQLDQLNSRDQVNALRLYGVYVAATDNLDSGLVYLYRALNLAEEIGYAYGIHLLEIEIGTAYLDHGYVDIAHEWCMKAQPHVEAIPGHWLLVNLCECLFQTYQHRGDSGVALRYLGRVRSLEQKNQAIEMTRQVDMIGFDRQRLQDSLAHVVVLAEEARHRDLLTNGLISGAILFALVAGGLYYRTRYMKKSNDVISRERDRSDRLLLNILPAEVARELKERGESTARTYDAVSILFTDFVNFTQTSEQLAATELVDEINACYKAFDEICDRHGIEKIKTIGDSYMAAGGVPIPDAEAARKTVVAALEMSTYITSRKHERSAQGLVSFSMRTGVHTGPVVAGIVGVKKFQYDIWGDTVNTASRMESYGEAGKVNVSQSTYELLKDDPDLRFTPRGVVDVKGKGEIEMWFVEKA